MSLGQYWEIIQGCSEQQYIIEHAHDRKNVFVTGGAGVGKTFLKKFRSLHTSQHHSPYQHMHNARATQLKYYQPRLICLMNDQLQHAIATVNVRRRRAKF